MTYRLLDDTDQYRAPRRAPISGRVVVHDSASWLDRIAPDTGAENVLRFIETDDAPHSYHELGDTDSGLLLLPDEVEAFGALGGVNRDAWHICIAARPEDMNVNDPLTFLLLDWLAQRMVAFWQRNGFDPLEATLLSKEDGAVFGWLHHGDLQSDRSDAWAHHPQRHQLDHLLVERIAFHANPNPLPPEADMPAFIARHEVTGEIVLIDPAMNPRHIPTPEDVKKYQEVAKLPGSSIIDRQRPDGTWEKDGSWIDLLRKTK